MSEREAFDRILALLHEAVLDDAHWPTASGLIDATLRAHGNALVCGDGHTGGDIQIYFAGFYYRGHRHRELERDYFEVYHPLDERIPRLRALPDSRLVHITDLYTEEELHNSVTFNELSSHTHSREAINIRLDGPNGSRIVWAVNDPVDGDGWSSAQLDSIRRLLPHIRQYVRVRQALAGAGALLEAFALFEKRVKQLGPDVSALCAGLRKLRIVAFELKGEDNPQRIFETMNTCGRDLTCADMIGNFILMPLGRERQERLYADHLHPIECGFERHGEEHFDAFIRHFLTLRTGEVPKQGEEYTVFRTHARLLFGSRIRRRSASQPVDFLEF